LTPGGAGAILARVTELDLLRTEEADAAPDGAPAGEPSGEHATGAPEPGADPEQGAAPAGPGPGNDLDDEELLQRTAALLFASPDPLSTERLVHLLERPEKPRVRAALVALGLRLDEARLPIALTEIAGGWRLFSRPEQADVIQRLARVQRQEKVTPAALETLAIVAYRQPVTSAEVEAIRGVQSGPMLRALVDRGLVRVTGRADQPGAPLQYGTTREFLDRFGLASLKDLPRDGELARD
jgi:segregation and condensation protein B